MDFCVIRWVYNRQLYVKIVKYCILRYLRIDENVFYILKILKFRVLDFLNSLWFN